MNHAVGFLKLTFCLALVSTGLVFAQTTPDAVPTKTAATVAYVYVGTKKGINLYDAAANGKLTLVSGSPFKTPAGLLIGSNGKYLITLGTYYVHSYLVASNGAIGRQASQINTQDYYGNGNCDGDKPGTAGMATLGHTGKNLYVTFPFVTPGSCSASIQTYNITKSGGLTFNDGIMTGSNAGTGLFQSPTIIANNTFAYAASDFFCCGQSGAFSGYVLGSNGGMQNLTFNMSDNISPLDYAPLYVTADPTNHLAALVSNVSEESYGPAQLASYTVDTQGNLSTTSTAKNMPYPKVKSNSKFPGWTLNLSPSGKLLAVGGIGLQVFHFNGASPMTPYSGLLTTAQIHQIHWDNNHHLFALSDTNNRLYVFTVTPTGITQAPGSPYTVLSPNALAVVVK